MGMQRASTLCPLSTRRKATHSCDKECGTHPVLLYKGAGKVQGRESLRTAAC